MVIVNSETITDNEGTIFNTRPKHIKTQISLLLV